MRETTLGDICELKYGKSLPSKKRTEGAFPVYGSNGRVGVHVKAITKAPAIVIGRKGSIGELQYSENPCWPIDTTYYVDATASDADLRWLYHAMKSLRLNDLNKATGVPGLNRNDAYQKKIILPNREEQGRIAAILDKADDIRRKRDQSIILVDDCIRSFYQHIFGDPNSNKFGFAVGCVENLCEIITDCLHTTPKHFNGPNEFPSIRSSELQNGYIDLSTAKYVTNKEYRVRIQRHQPESDDIIYCREGARFGSVGRIPEGMTPCLGQRTMLFRSNRDVCVPDYLWSVMRSDFIIDQANLAVGGAASPHVNIRDIRKFPCLLPPIEVQKGFSRMCQNLLRQRKNLLEQTRQASGIFSVLSLRAFRGEL